MTRSDKLKHSRNIQRRSIQGGRDGGIATGNPAPGGVSSQDLSPSVSCRLPMGSELASIKHQVEGKERQSKQSIDNMNYYDVMTGTE